MKKHCQQCETEFEYKRDSAKFCSDKCRVKWNRKNPKTNTNEIKPYQMQALYNQMVELIENFNPINNRTDLWIKEEDNGFPQAISSTTKKQLNIIRSAEQWHQLKRECESQEEWAKLKNEILNAPNLSPKQIQLILNTP